MFLGNSCYGRPWPGVDQPATPKEECPEVPMSVLLAVSTPTRAGPSPDGWGDVVKGQKNKLMGRQRRKKRRERIGSGEGGSGGAGLSSRGLRSSGGGIMNVRTARVTKRTRCQLRGPETLSQSYRAGLAKGPDVQWGRRTAGSGLEGLPEPAREDPGGLNSAAEGLTRSHPESPEPPPRRASA